MSRSAKASKVSLATLEAVAAQVAADFGCSVEAARALMRLVATDYVAGRR